MPTFEFTNLASGGGGGVETLEAPDRATALRELMGRGVVPGTLKAVGGSGAAKASGNGASSASKGGERDEPARAKGAAGASAAAGGATARAGRGGALAGLTAPRMTGAETASFIRELAVALQAGLPLVPALKTLGQAGRSGAQRAMLKHVTARVEQGSSLADAFKSWGKPFGELVVNLVRAGEASGKLADTLVQCADLLERDLHIRGLITGAMVYPAIVFVVVAGAILVLTTYVLPKLLEPFKGRDVVLPLPTQIVQGFANVVTAYWWLILLLFAGAVLLMAKLRAMPGPRLAMDGALLRVPVLGPMLKEAAVARFARTLSTLLRSGLTALTALRLTSATLSNAALRKGIDGVCEQVQAGKTIAGPLERTGLFPSLLVQIVNLGERSGKLPELLSQAAKSLDSRTETRITVFSKVLPNIMFLVAAVIVSVVILAILMPLLQMQEMIAG